MSDTEAAVGRVRREHYECEDRFYSCPKSDGGCADDNAPHDLCTCGADDANAALDTLLAALTTAQEEARTFRLAVVMALGPCAPEHEGTPVVEAIQRLQEERDAANAHIALLEGEGHTGCDERIYQAEQEVEALTRDLATLRERLAGVRAGVEGMQRWDLVDRADEDDVATIAHDPEGEYLYRSDVLRRLSMLDDRAVAVIRGEEKNG